MEMINLGKIMHQFIIFFIAIFISCSAYAADKFNLCSVTKITTNDYEPAIFEKSNNLLKKAGQEVIISGDRIVIYGKVLDQNCLPISDAKVYIWQANGHGKYPYEPLRNIAKNHLIEIDKHTTFTGNGTATTNNKGEFVFLTLMPHSVHGLKPHINIRVEHFNFNEIQSRFTLDDSNINNIDYRLIPDPIIKYAKDNNLYIYNFDVILPGLGMKKYMFD